jgi:hypothetical protein
MFFFNTMQMILLCGNFKIDFPSQPFRVECPIIAEKCSIFATFWLFQLTLNFCKYFAVLLTEVPICSSSFGKLFTNLQH